MKTFDLTTMGVHEMSAPEMKETDGGWIFSPIRAWALAVKVIELIAESNSEKS
jgi:hypothetical protein